MRAWMVVVAITFATAVGACSKSPSHPSDPAAASTAAKAEPASKPVALAAATSSGYVAPGPYEAAHGDEDCTEDCSGHEAGYRWAEEHDITDEEDCTGDSESFIEGCKAYVEDNS